MSHSIAKSPRPNAPNASLRHDWTRREVEEIYHRPLLDLVFAAQQVHRQFHDPAEVQLCQLLSIKTGGCPEDCAYCPQSAHYADGRRRTRTCSTSSDVAAAGAQGARRRRHAASAWARRGAKCATARNSKTCWKWSAASRRWAWKSAARWACSPTIRRAAWPTPASLPTTTISTPRRNFTARSSPRARYEDRLRTIAAVRRAGITVCCGGIIGMGESDEDRIGLLHQLATLDPHPGKRAHQHAGARRGHAARPMPSRSIRSTLVRTIATARMLMPASHGAPQRRPPLADARSRGALLPRRSQFHLRRRKTAHHAQSRARRRRSTLSRSRPASPRAMPQPGS